MDYSFETNYNIVMCASSKHLIDHAHKMIKSSAGAQIKTMCVMDTQNNVFTLITFTYVSVYCLDLLNVCYTEIYVHMMDYSTPFRQPSSVFPNFYVYDR